MGKVALETAVLTHGLPESVAIECALSCEAAARQGGGEPVTIGILKGEPVIGLSEEQIRLLGGEPGSDKASLHNLPIIMARKRSAGTTVAATLFLAAQAGISAMSTGGIGGAHRGGGDDVSSDLTQLATTSAIVVCSGVKIVLDVRRTRERLETLGITLLGWRTERMPGFYCAETDESVDAMIETPREAAEILSAKRRAGLPGAVIVAVPPPMPMDRDRIESIVEDGFRKAPSGPEQTPYLLEYVSQTTEGESMAANIALLCNNARIAGQIAVELGSIRT